jgi:predicted RNA-binding Zn-ribbon protein involved in translation (DUF1610 family)
MSYSDASKSRQKIKKPVIMNLHSSRRIVCPDCGNKGVVLTTRFNQNKDGSFSQELDDSQVLGQVKFYCGDCGADLTHFHKRFLEMLF